MSPSRTATRSPRTAPRSPRPRQPEPPDERAHLLSVPIEDTGDALWMFDPATGCEFRVMDVDPGGAAYWLDTYNSDNRSRRSRVVGAYSDDMEHDRWFFTGDPVRFGRDGLLYDGQHRLQAIVNSGRSQRLLVIRGLREDARTAIDGGAMRKVADDLKIGGHASKNLAALSSIARRAVYWQMGERLPNNAPRAVTRSEVVEFVKLHPELPYAARRGLQVYAGTGKTLPPSVSGFVFWLTVEVDEQAAGIFFEQLETQVNIPGRSPVLALLRRAREGGGLRDADWIYLLLKAWILFRSDRPTDRLQLPRNRLQGKPMTSAMIPDPSKVLPPPRGGAGEMDPGLAEL